MTSTVVAHGSDTGRGSAATPSPGRSLGYQPALDGLRGLAVLAIFAFHAGFTWAPGAFLSVSTFFTLSGFLITFLLLAEHERHGRIDRRAFWTRRARRLLPASLVTIAGIVLAAALFADAAQLQRLRGDVLAALAYVANWRFISLGDAYGALFQSESPMQHFWSLAIEEQYYLLYPLLFIGILAVARGSRRRMLAALGGLVGLSLAASLLLQAGGASTDRLYFGTDVRAAELLVGALFAVWWSGHRHVGDTVGRRTVRYGGLVALVLMLVLWAVARQDGRAWYQGGLIAYSLVTAFVVLAAVQAEGPVRRVLSAKPLVALGVISYGAYLIHWPVFVWLNESTGLAPWPLFALRVAVTIGLAVVMYRVIETPVREGRSILTRRALLVVPAVVVAVLAASVLVGSIERGQAYDFQDAKARLAAQAAAPPSGTAPATGFTEAMFGDSTALMTGLGVGGWGPDHGVYRGVGGWAELGCATVEAPRLSGGNEVFYPDVCRGWVDQWATKAREERPDVALVQLGPWEVADTQLPGDDVYRSLGDPVLDDAVRRQLARGVDALLDAGAGKVLLLTSPYIDSNRRNGVSPPTPFPESDRARMDRWNQIVREVADERSRVGIVDLAAYQNGLPDEVDRRLRPDGVHLTWDTANEVATWLGPEIARVAGTLPGP
ncbi:MAG: acyltransferase family protein [Acidimicrobiales bacterium]